MPKKNAKPTPKKPVKLAKGGVVTKPAKKGAKRGY